MDELIDPGQQAMALPQCQACGRSDAERRTCGHVLCADCYLFAPFRVVDGREIQCPICLPRP